jgi:hypothetical protein
MFNLRTDIRSILQKVKEGNIEGIEGSNELYKLKVRQMMFDCLTEHEDNLILRLRLSIRKNYFSQQMRTYHETH